MCIGRCKINRPIFSANRVLKIDKSANCKQLLIETRSSELSEIYLTNRSERTCQFCSRTRSIFTKSNLFAYNFILEVSSPTDLQIACAVKLQNYWKNLCQQLNYYLLRIELLISTQPVFGTHFKYGFLRSLSKKYMSPLEIELD